MGFRGLAFGVKGFRVKGFRVWVKRFRVLGFWSCLRGVTVRSPELL